MDFVTKYKNCEIWFDGDDSATCPSPRWVISTELQTYFVIYFDGPRPIEEVKNYIDECVSDEKE